MKKTLFLFSLTFCLYAKGQTYVTTNTVQNITANKVFSGNSYGFNGYSTQWYTEGMQTDWLITHRRFDVTDPAEPVIILSRPTAGSNLNFGGGGLDIGVANTTSSWGVSPAIGDVVFKAEGTSSSLIIGAASGNIKFFNLPTFQGASFATQTWVNSNNFATTSSPTSGYISKFSTSNVIGNSGLFQNTNGNILIGKTTQTNTTYLLDVNGNIRSNKLVINTTGADFVFNPAYKLRSLFELENYINSYHHLPEIESAETMQANGMDVGKIQTQLLQKIEELTLYTIDQNKMQQTQQNIIENLNTQLKSQQKLLEELKLMVDRLSKGN